MEVQKPMKIEPGSGAGLKNWYLLGMMKSGFRVAWARVFALATRMAGSWLFCVSWCHTPRILTLKTRVACHNLVGYDMMEVIWMTKLRSKKGRGVYPQSRHSEEFSYGKCFKQRR
jgi:hypothetical protein